MNLEMVRVKYRGNWTRDGVSQQYGTERYNFDPKNNFICVIPHPLYRKLVKWRPDEYIVTDELMPHESLRLIEKEENEPLNIYQDKPNFKKEIKVKSTKKVKK